MNKKNYKYIIIFISLIILYFIFHKKIKYFNKLIIVKSYYYRKLFTIIYEENIILSLIFLFFTEFLIILFPLPLYLIFNSMIYLVINNYIITLFILTFLSVIAAYLTRIIYRNYLPNYIKDWLFGLTYYKIILKYGKINPIYYTLLIRLLNFLTCFKELWLSYTDIQEKYIIFTSIIGYFYCIFQSILIGEGWDSYQKFILFDDELGKKNVANKILMIVSLILNIVLLFIIC